MPREGKSTGPNPTDRGKPGSKPYLLCDHQGLPLTCAVSATNVNDIERWERKASTFLAMLGTACILICYKHLAKHADGF
ncbi:hypothetical protein [Nocardiopsis sp. LOL_012]|uniref:hypothetical protein n=1 Tax=Nocardiopsis sp. LOL_012 TaxID=3345409 RepID=UPI003A84ADB3